MSRVWYPESESTWHCQIGVDWQASETETTVTLNPIIYRWDSANTADSATYEVWWNGTKIGSGSFTSGSGTRQQYAVGSRTITKTSSEQTIDLGVSTSSNFGTWYSGSFHTLGNKGIDFYYTVPAKLTSAGRMSGLENKYFRIRWANDGATGGTGSSTAYTYALTSNGTSNVKFSTAIESNTQAFLFTLYNASYGSNVYRIQEQANGYYLYSNSSTAGSSNKISAESSYSSGYTTWGIDHNDNSVALYESSNSKGGTYELGLHNTSTGLNIGNLNILGNNAWSGNVTTYPYPAITSGSGGSYGSTYPSQRFYLEEAYKVTYNANGGSGAPNAQFKFTSTNMTISTTVPTRSGYTFAGWATSSSATVAKWAAGGIYDVNTTQTLYAVWTTTLTLTIGTGISTIYYKVNGASTYSSTTSSTSITVATKTTIYCYAVAATGYRYTEYDSTYPWTAYVNSAKAYAPTGTPKTYTISYSNAGSTSGTVPEDQTKTYGTSLTLRTNVNSLAHSSVDSAAQRQRTVTISYDANNGSSAPSQSTGTATDSGTTTTTWTPIGWASGGGTVYTVDESNYTSSNTISCNIGDTIKIKYTASSCPDSWGYAADCYYGLNSSNSSSWVNSLGSSYDCPGLTASGTSLQWTKIWELSGITTTAGTYKYQKVYIYSDGSEEDEYSTAGGTITIIVSSTSTSPSYTKAYDFGGTYSTNADTMLCPAWTTSSSTTYQTDGNASITLSSTTPTRTGYTFKGWSTSSTATSATYSANKTYTFNTDTTLYAVWSANALTFADQTTSSTYGTAGSLTVSAASNGTGTYTYSWTSVTGFSFDASTRVLSSTSTLAAGSYSISITAKDSNSGASKTKTVTWTVNKASGSIIYTASQSGTITYSTSSQSTSITAPTASTGTLSYTEASETNSSGTATSYFTINSSTGAITTAAKTPVGKYTIKITVNSAASDNYNAITGTITYTMSIKPAGSIEITGTNTYNQTLTVSVTNTNNASLACQWYYNSSNSKSGGTAISGATSFTYTIDSGLVGNYIYVIVTATLNSVSASWSDITDATNNATAIVSKATPTFTGTDGSTTYNATAYGTVKASVAGTCYYGTSTSSMTTTKTLTANTAATIVSQSTVGTSETYYCYFVPTDTTNYNGVGSSSSYAVAVKATMGQATGSITYSPSALSVTYSTSKQTKNCTAATSSTGTITYTLNSVTNSSSTAQSGYSLSGTTLTIPASAAAGSYTVSITATSTDSAGNYTTATSTKTFTLTVSKATPSVSVTTYTSNKYTGSAVNLATATSSNCTYYLGYSTSSSTDSSTVTWLAASTSITSGTSGISKDTTYYIWYKATGATNYSDIPATYSGTAKYTYQTYTISYNAGDADSGSAPASQTKTYGTALTLQSNSGSLAHSSTSGSTSKSGAITLAYNLNGGNSSAISNNTGSSVTISGTYPITWTAAGWGTSSGTTTKAYSFGGSYTTNAAATFYPAWTKTNGTTTYTATSASATITSTVPTKSNTTSSGTITITYNANGGSSTPSSGSGTYTNTTPYTFSKWAAGSTSGTQYASGASYSASIIASTTVTMYAIWTTGTTTRASNPSITTASAITRNNTDTTGTITITYDANGGSGAPSSSTDTYINTTPYTFNGWHLNSTSGTTYSAATAYTFSSSGTLYAGWTEGTTTRKSNPNITLSSTLPTRTNYECIGWSTSSSATSATYTAGGTYTFSKDTTLYAVWKIKKLTFNGSVPTTITYNGNDVKAVTYNGTTIWEKS